MRKRIHFLLITLITSLCHFSTLFAQEVYNVGSFVWEDINRNGISDDTEPGIDGISVRLFTELGLMVDETVTSGGGLYTFFDVPEGNYYLAFGKPSGYSFTLALYGSDYLIDSDVDGSNGPGTTYAFNVGQNLESVPEYLRMNAGLVDCGNPSCENPINLSINLDCAANISPDMVLSNEIIGVPENYEIKVYDQVGNEIDMGNLTEDQIGKSFEVVVTDLICNNSCSTEILIEDKIDPIIECISDTITCGDLIVFLDPVVTDNCNDFELILLNEAYEDVACDDDELQTIITRTWLARDSRGRESDPCIQTLSISKFDINTIDFPIDQDTVLSCSGDYQLDKNGNPHPTILGVPTLSGVPLWPDQFVECNVYVSYEDEPFNFGNDCIYGIQRTWTVSNWICGSDNSRTFGQFFTFVDTTGPELSNLPEDITLSTVYNDCAAYVTIPAITAVDDCNNNLRINTKYPGGFVENQNGIENIAVPMGTHPVTYYVYDGCNNVSTHTYNITVIDDAEPVTICDGFTTVAINTEGIGSLTAEKLDDGSFDECGPVTLSIRRMTVLPGYEEDLEFGEEVSFYCEEVGTEVMVILQVTDASGNSNRCMAVVEVQDKIPVILLEGLPDITVGCTFPFDQNNLEVFGTLVNTPEDREEIIIDSDTVNFSGPALDGLVIDNCATSAMSEVSDFQIDQCGIGYITRTITATSPNGEVVTDIQVITFVNPDPFSEEDITWPLDGEINNACSTNPEDLPEGFDFPILDEDACDMVSYTYEDSSGHGQGGCATIERHWYVSDWCQRIEGKFPVWEHIQFITVNNEIAPVFTSSCDDVTVSSEVEICDGADVNLIASATDDCTDTESLEYTFEIDYDNDGSVDSIGTGNDASDFYPTGTHEITFIVNDGCGNSAECTYTFTIIEGNAPELDVCNDLTVNTSENCDSALVNLIGTASDDYTKEEDLVWSFEIDLNSNGSIDSVGTGNDASGIYPLGTHEITFMVFDACDKSDTCTSSFTVNYVAVAPVITEGCEDITLGASSGNCDSAFVSLVLTATDDFTPEEELEWSFAIDFDNDDSIDSIGVGNDASDIYPLGTHAITFIVFDECGSSDTCSFNFTITNEPTPEAICLEDVSISVLPVDTNNDNIPDTAAVVIHPSIIDDGSFVNCYDGEIFLSFSADINDTTRIYNCSDVDSVYVIELWITDTVGRSDFCVTTISIVDTNAVDYCTPPFVKNCIANDYTGMTVVTCNVDFDNGGARGDIVGAIYDTRFNASAPRGANWGNTPPIAPVIPTPNWTYEEIGPVFGIALDANANVYLGQTDVYNIFNVEVPPGTDVSYDPGWIYKASPPSFMATQFVQLPNTGGPLNGIGNLIFDNKNDKLYASNLEDGKIYRISSAGVIEDTYDPFGADDGTPGTVELSEQIWGIGLNKEGDRLKIYFPQITESSRKMFSIDVTNGTFPAPGSEVEEFSNIEGIIPRITDIDFSQDGTKMIFTERGLERTDAVQVDFPLDNPGVGLTAHLARTLNYELIGGEWVQIIKANGDQKYFVGGDLRDDGNNSAGGVSFGFREADGNPLAECDSLIWVSGNALNMTFATAGASIYGIQGIDYAGNESGRIFGGNRQTDIYIDFDNVVGDLSAKGNIGDVQVFPCGTEIQDQLVGINGEIYTEEHFMVDDTKVELTGNESLLKSTDKEGKYEFGRFPKGSTFKVKPSRDFDPMNGVSTLDLVLIQDHILGKKKLQSPYKLIAADVNNNGGITSSDLIELRKMVLGLYDDFPNNKSWRFIDAGYEFLYDQEPWAHTLPEEYEIYDQNSDMEIDFIGVKIGDVNSSVVLNNKPGAEIRNLVDQFNLTFEDKEVKAGSTVTVPIYANDLNTILGYQMTLKVDPEKSSLIGIKGYTATHSEHNFGIKHLNEGLLTVSWNKWTDDDLNTEEPIFTIELIVKEDAKISELVNIGNDITTSEAYGRNYEIIGVTLEKRTQESENSDEVELYQNRPNPWNNNTSIMFSLPEASKARLTIYDLSGKVIRSINNEFQAGMNEVIINNEDLGAAGIYYYELITETFKATKKMVLIR